MKPLALGAVVALLLVVFGLPSVPLATLLPVLVEPVVLGFAAGILARPHLTGRRWSR
jgi:hypothetical protein